MKKVCIVTDVPFWRQSAGNEKRISELLRFLRTCCSPHVFYVGTPTSAEVERLRNDYGAELEFCAFGRSRYLHWIKSIVNSYLPSARPYLQRLRKTQSLQDRMSNRVKERFQAYIKDQAIDSVIIEYVWLMYTVENLDVLKIIDTHDVQSETRDAFRARGKSYDFSITLDEEIALLERADVVVAINKRDSTFLVDRIGSEIIEYPYFEPLELSASELPDSGYSLAFVASALEFNIDAISWFIEDVWDSVLLKCPSAQLNVYGSVSPYVKKDDHRSIRPRGFVTNIRDAYAQNSLVVNPIRFGSGLKIKCIEALAHHRPLITTSVGAQGIEDANGKALLIADGADEFADCIVKLFENPEQRKHLSAGAAEYCETLSAQVRTAQQRLASLLTAERRPKLS
jgi:glycosyltransferase involved in cell wall biosynthesis